jgi:molybdopterin-guanine dinucleotide biosynthesis protein A
VARLEARTRVLPLTGDAALVVLAGGRSSRMGRAKRDLPVGGGTLLEWIVARLGPAFAETLVAGGAAPRGARAVADRHPDAGPLAGIEASLLAMRAERAFVVACDLPNAGVRLASFLLERCAGADAAVPRVAGRAQPTCAVYARSAATKLGAYLDAGERRAIEALDRLNVVYVDDADLATAGVAASELDDLDTPADYDAFIASLRA